MSDNKTKNINLKKLKRAQLLEMLIEQSKEVRWLRQELGEAREELKKRTATYENPGSLAQASLEVNEVFQTAQKAADHYLDNIKKMEEEAREKYRQTMAKAEKDANQYWEQLSLKLENFYQAHKGLREMIAMKISKETEE